MALGRYLRRHCLPSVQPDDYRYRVAEDQTTSKGRTVDEEEEYNSQSNKVERYEWGNERKEVAPTMGWLGIPIFI